MSSPAGPETNAVHGSPFPADPVTGKVPLGEAEAAPTAVDDGDAAALSINPTTRALRVEGAGGAMTGNPDAIHVAFNEGGTLAAGDSDVTFRTVTAAKFSTLKSCMAAYTGTVTGVELQLLAGGVPVAPPVGALSSGVFVSLIPPGIEVPADAAEVYAVRVLGATLNDDLDVNAHLVETDA